MRKVFVDNWSLKHLLYFEQPEWLRRRARKIARVLQTLICTYTLIYYFYLFQL
jgi:hypothetical protein